MRLKKIAIGVALASGTMAAQAGDVVFFPYVVSGGSVTTLVSVINGAAEFQNGVLYYNANGTAQASYSSPNFRYLHWAFQVKTAESPTAVCNDQNGFFPTSPLDVVTYDVAAVRGNNGVLFEDPAMVSNLATGKNAFGSLPLASGKRATLFVHNAGSQDAKQLLTGDALILEYDTGAAWGYAALENHSPGVSGVEAALSTGDFDYSWVGPLDTDISFGPQDEVTTRIFITPVNAAGSSMVNTLQDFKGNLTTSVQLSSPIPGTGQAISVFDRDESGFSSTNPVVSVTCVYPVDLIPNGSIPGLVTSPVVQQYVNDTGGWTHISSLINGSPTINSNTVAIKLDFRAAGAGGDFEMPVGTGAFNNSYVLNPPYSKQLLVPAAVTPVSP